MSIKRTTLCTALLGVLLASGSGFSQARPDLGKREFETNCAMSTYLNRAPANLATLATSNGGVLPMDRMYATIDGAREVPGHGTREMPAWGNDYRMQAARDYWEVPYDPEIVVRAKILALLEYINRLQVK